MTTALALLVLGLALAAVSIALLRARRRTAELEARIRRLESDAAEAEDARRRFLEQLAHELRTPLTAILGYQELMADGIYGDLGEKCAEAIGRIGRASLQLQHLIDGMFEVFLEQEAPELHIESVPLEPAFERILEYARGVAVERSLGIDASIEAPLPVVETDPDRLHRALYLAVLAAARATKTGALRVRARPLDNGAELEVAGTGLVTAPATDAQQTVFGGAAAHLGLRLAIARRVAESLGGGLTLEPENGGTTLRLRIHGSSPPPSD